MITATIAKPECRSVSVSICDKWVLGHDVPRSQTRTAEGLHDGHNEKDQTFNVQNPQPRETAL